MISRARQSPAVPGFRVIADFRWLYTFRYVFLVPIYTQYIPGIYKQIDTYLPYIPLFRRLHSEQSIWQFSVLVFPPLIHGVIWSASIPFKMFVAIFADSFLCLECRPFLSFGKSADIQIFFAAR